jgi:hypothetical protein
MNKPIGATQEQLDSNNIKWVLTGGLSIGLKTTPSKWQLRHSSEYEWQQEKTHLLQKIADLTRKTNELEGDINTIIDGMMDPSPELDNDVEEIISKYRL